MLGRYNETSRCEIDVLNGIMRTGLTAPCAVRCFAPVYALAAQRKSPESVYIYFTPAPIFRVDRAARKAAGLRVNPRGSG